MIEIYDPKEQKYPIKAWIKSLSALDEGCFRQAVNLSRLPFLHKWVALMPDTHTGFGMPIGGVIASRGVIIPNAVGVDIGCGMAFLQTDLPAEILRRKNILPAIIDSVMGAVPLGFDRHKQEQKSSVLDNALLHRDDPDFSVAELDPEIGEGYFQTGTLGGGNHFIEFQEDENGMFALMVHSGSRNFGYKICRYFNRRAKAMDLTFKGVQPAVYDLAALPAESREGRQYLNWMKTAQDFAAENRRRILERTLDICGRILRKQAKTAGWNNTLEIHAHHNYACLENHYGEEVFVHRKGAISAAEGEYSIIPGAMGSQSFIVRGEGKKEAFGSCSHGAGRRLGRKAAVRQIPVEKTLQDLKRRGVVLGKRNIKDVSEESRFAYKDIKIVLEQEKDLALPVKELRTVGVIKG
jgi:tRNA-splicing ligase RtcB (3'-phosphate/5'-hydroxy nucleic acid ligase)